MTSFEIFRLVEDSSVVWALKDSNLDGVQWNRTRQMFQRPVGAGGVGDVCLSASTATMLLECLYARRLVASGCGLYEVRGITRVCVPNPRDLEGAGVAIASGMVHRVKTGETVQGIGVWKRVEHASRLTAMVLAWKELA